MWYATLALIKGQGLLGSETPDSYIATRVLSLGESMAKMLAKSIEEDGKTVFVLVEKSTDKDLKIVLEKAVQYGVNLDKIIQGSWQG